MNEQSSGKFDKHIADVVKTVNKMLGFILLQTSTQTETETFKPDLGLLPRSRATAVLVLQHTEWPSRG